MFLKGFVSLPYAASGNPEAELWLGAHSGSPSVIIDPTQTAGATTLDDWIAAVHAAVKLGDDPTKRLDTAAKLDELEAELKKLIAAHPAADPAQREKEQQCLDFVATFARQFGPPR